MKQEMWGHQLFSFTVLLLNDTVRLLLFFKWIAIRLCRLYWLHAKIADREEESRHIKLKPNILNQETYKNTTKIFI